MDREAAKATVFELLEEVIAEHELSQPKEMRKMTCPYRDMVNTVVKACDEIPTLRKMLWGLIITLLGFSVSIGIWAMSRIVVSGTWAEIFAYLK